jgi:predicted phage-related endonuclease
LTPDDKALRRSGLGGSDIAAILGMSPYRKPFDVYLEKTGQLDDPIEESERIWAGKRLERVIAEMYTEKTGRAHQWMDKTLPAVAGAGEHRIWTPDALVDPDGGMDAKNVAWDQGYQWGLPDTADVPDHIAIQANWYIDCSAREWWDIAAFFGGHELRIYRVVRDPETIGMMREAAEKFWRDHVVLNVPPPLEYSAGAERWLKKRFPNSSGILREIESPDEYAVVTAYAEAKAAFDAAEAQKKNWALRLKALIGDADGLSIGGKPVCTNRKSKDSTETDWQSVAIPLLRTLPPETADQLVSLHTKAVEGSRRLLLKKEKT